MGGGILTLSEQEQTLIEREGTGCNKCTLWVRGIRGWVALTMNQRRQVLTGEQIWCVANLLYRIRWVGTLYRSIVGEGTVCCMYFLWINIFSMVVIIGAKMLYRRSVHWLRD